MGLNYNTWKQRVHLKFAGAQSKAKFIAPRFYAVLFEGVGAATCCAQAALAQVQRDDGAGYRFKLVGVATTLQLGIAVVAHRKLKIAAKTDLLCAVVKRKTAHSAAVAVGLRQNIRHKMLIDSAAVGANRGFCAVDVVFPRAFAKVFQVFKIFYLKSKY